MIVFSKFHPAWMAAPPFVARVIYALLGFLFAENHPKQPCGTSGMTQFNNPAGTPCYQSLLTTRALVVVRQVDYCHMAFWLALQVRKVVSTTKEISSNAPESAPGPNLLNLNPGLLNAWFVQFLRYVHQLGHPTRNLVNHFLF